MIIKKVVIITMLTVTFGLIQQVASFTEAMVQNTALLSVSNSENALIATPNELVLEVTKEITTTTRIIMSKGAEEKVCNVIEETPVLRIQPCTSTFHVKNNKDEIIYVDVYIDKGFWGNEIQGLSIKETEAGGIMPGETREFLLVIDESIKSGIADVLIFVKWSDGSAEIKSKITVDVNEVRNELFEYEYIDEALEGASEIKLQFTGIEPETIDAELKTMDAESDSTDIQPGTENTH